MAKQRRKRPIDPRLRRLTWRQQRSKTKLSYRRRTTLPGGLNLTKQSLAVISHNWQSLGLLLVIYGSLNFAITSSFNDIHQHFNSFVSQLNGHHFNKALQAFGHLFTSPGASHSSAGVVLQIILFILASLIAIWMLRHLLAKKPFRLSVAFYNSTGPLIPFLIVIFTLLVELLPLALAAAILGAINQPNIEVWGTIIFSIIFLLLLLATSYFVIPAILALYIVTLPAMQPLPALRSAHNLVRFRRWPILLRLIWLPVFIAAVMALAIIPLIMFAHFLVAPAFYALVLLAVLFSHTYLYNLYRSTL